ncbi:MAG: hypothetical protein JO152_11320 [Mycobacteriaceae bacterium]|nr:hypothetical protein [Mycobacteriaceae bacterium]
MTTAYLPAPPSPHAFRLPENIRWWDVNTECILVISQPSVDPDLWQLYLDGAQRSYRKHGVESVLDIDAIRNGQDTVLFWAALDGAGQVLAGVRAKGPLRSAEDSHAVVEWAGQPGEAAVRRQISDRLPFGVLEMKSAWITDDPRRNRGLTQAIARSGFHAMPLLGVQFCLATGATQVLERWQSSGGVLASAVPATPYPDERYQTRMMWWDRHSFARHGEPQQVASILREMREVTHCSQRAAGSAPATHQALV